MARIAYASKTMHGQLAGYVSMNSQASAAPTQQMLGWLGDAADDLYAKYDPNGKAGKPMDPAARPYWEAEAKKIEGRNTAIANVGTSLINTVGTALAAKYAPSGGPFPGVGPINISMPEKKTSPLVWIGIGAGVLVLLGVVLVATKKS